MSGRHYFISQCFKQGHNTLIAAKISEYRICSQLKTRHQVLLVTVLKQQNNFIYKSDIQMLYAWYAYCSEHFYFWMFHNPMFSEFYSIKHKEQDVFCKTTYVWQSHLPVTRWKLRTHSNSKVLDPRHMHSHCSLDRSEVTAKVEVYEQTYTWTNRET